MSITGRQAALHHILSTAGCILFAYSFQRLRSNQAKHLILAAGYIQSGHLREFSDVGTPKERDELLAKAPHMSLFPKWKKTFSRETIRRNKLLKAYRQVRLSWSSYSKSD